MPDAVVKYFYEEPVALEPLVPDTQADARPQATLGSLDALLAPAPYHRGYLAGRAADSRVGLTTVAASAWRPGLVAALDMPIWWRLDAGGTLVRVDAFAAFDALGDAQALVGGRDAPDNVWARAAAQPDRRRAVPAVRALLDAGYAVLLPEPAHDGHDLTLFAPHPIYPSLLPAWRAAPVEGVQRFLAPYQKMRAEHRFYFETWQLDDLPDYVERA